MGCLSNFSTRVAQPPPKDECRVDFDGRVLAIGSSSRISFFIETFLGESKSWLIGERRPKLPLGSLLSVTNGGSCTVLNFVFKRATWIVSFFLRLHVVQRLWVSVVSVNE